VVIPRPSDVVQWRVLQADRTFPESQAPRRIGAIELSEEAQPRRIRLESLRDFTAVTITGFVGRAVKRGATVISDRLASYRSLKDHNHQAKVVSPMAAHVLLPWIHRVFSNFKRWALGTYHGVRRKHLQRYLDEFAYR
jgi:transposase-like protein